MDWWRNRTRWAAVSHLRVAEKCNFERALRALVTARATEGKSLACNALALFCVSLLLALGSVLPASSQRANPEVRALLTNMLIQYALIWSGHYDGLTDGAIGANSISAMAALQRERGWPVTGRLASHEIENLILIARQNRTSIDFKLVYDGKSDFSIGVPKAITPRRSATRFGVRYASADGEYEIIVGRYKQGDRSLQQLYERVLKSRTITSKSIDMQRSEKFFVSGDDGQFDYYYTGRIDENGDVLGLSIKSPQAMRDLFGRIVVGIANTFHKPGIEEAFASTEAERRPPVVTGSIERASPSKAKKEESSGLALSAGSGFFVDRKGHILTNNHVAGKCDQIVVDGFGLARLVRSDPGNDLALIKVPQDSRISAARFRRNDVELGEDILAFGFPLTGILAQSINVTRGNVSSLAGRNNDSRHFQVSAPVQPGNSGGPLVDSAGQVIGVVAHKLNLLQAARATGSIPENIAFAIRGQVAKSFLRTAGVDLQVEQRTQLMRITEISKEATSYTVLIYCAAQKNH